MKKLSIVLSLLVMLIFCMMNVVLADTHEAFSFESIVTQEGENFFDIEMVDDTIVVTANSGNVLVSKDEGENWKKVKLDTEYDLNSLCTDGKQFVVRDGNNNIFISKDGEKWNTVIRVTDKIINSMRYIDGHFWLIGEDILFKSKDAVNWESFASDCSGLKEFAHDGKGLYLAIINNSLYKSSNLVDFEKCTAFGDKRGMKIIYNNGKFIIACAFGYMAETVDGNDIKFKDDFKGNYYISNMEGLKVFNNIVYACDQDGRVRKFVDSVSNPYTVAKPLNNFRSDTVCNRFVVTDSEKVIVANSNGQIFVNENGYKVKYDNYTSNYALSYVEKNGNTYLVGNQGGNLLVFKGKQLLNDAKIKDLEGDVVKYGDGEFFMKGSTSYTARSTDGINFTVDRKASNKYVASLYEYFGNMVYYSSQNNNIYLFKGNGNYERMYTTRFLMHTNLVHNDKLIFAGEFGSAYVIDSNWNVTPININRKNVYQLISAGNNVIALHTDNTISISSDLKNWENIKINTKININSIAYSPKGVYMAVGNTGLAISSTDLKTWYVCETATKLNLSQVIFDGEQFVCTGNAGIVLRTINSYNTKEVITAEEVEVDKTTVRVFVNNELIEFDQNPIIRDGRTLVPLRQIFEALGCEVEWNQESQKVTAKGKDGTTIELTIKNQVAKVDGKEVTIDVAPDIVNGRTLVPVRFISESMNAKVLWEDFSATVYVDEIQ